MSTSAVVVLAPGFEEIEAVTPIDVLRRAGVTVTVAGVGGTTITGAHGITLTADCRMEDITATPNAIILPGGMPGSEHLGKSEAVKRLTLAVHEKGGLCAALCAAPALTLAPWGILDGKTATCYPSFEEKFGASTTASEKRVVVDGSVITSRGPGTALEFALAITECLTDAATAARLRDGMIVN